MIKRTVDISQASYLYLKNRQLLIDQQGEMVGSVPVEDLGILILEHPAITLTQGVLLACQKNNVAVVFCDERHLPYSTLLPISEGHQLHNKVLQQQITVTTCYVPSYPLAPSTTDPIYAQDMLSTTSSKRSRQRE